MKKGELYVISGCMGSGKTEMLFHHLTRRKLAKQSYVIYKNRIDDRNPALSAKIGQIGSRNGITLTARLAKDADEILADVIDDEALGTRCDVIAIDEAQFFDKRLPNVIRYLTEVKGYDVYVTGLPQDFRGEPFGVMPQLLAMADHLDLLDAVCAVCGKSATKTQRLIEGKPAYFDSPIIQVGGDDSYEARCVEHHEVPRRRRVEE